MKKQVCFVCLLLSVLTKFEINKVDFYSNFYLTKNDGKITLKTRRRTIVVIIIKESFLK